MEDYRRIGRLATALVVAAICLAWPAAGAAQTPQETVAKIRQAFAASGNAATIEDYEKIIATLDEVLADAQLGDNDRDYVRSLKGWAHNRRGESLVQSGQEEQALAEFDRAVDLNNQHWKAMHNRGVSLAHIGRVDEAIADFGRVLNLKQDYPNSWFNRGELLYEQGQFEKAMADYNRAIELDSEDPGFYNSRGHAYYRLRQFDKAVADYDKSIQYDPQNPAAHVNRGDVLLELGRYEDAAKDYMTAIELDANLGRAYQSAAWMMAVCPVERFRDSERAVNAAEKAVELDGREDYRYLETVAAALANAERFEEAVQLQTEVVKLAPTADKARTESLLALFKADQPFRLPEVQAETARRPE